MLLGAFNTLFAVNANSLVKFDIFCDNSSSILYSQILLKSFLKVILVAYPGCGLTVAERSERQNTEY